jgi:hypothetical protein
VLHGGRRDVGEEVVLDDAALAADHEVQGGGAEVLEDVATERDAACVAEADVAGRAHISLHVADDVRLVALADEVEAALV